jgi:hypothetical protein
MPPRLTHPDARRLGLSAFLLICSAALAGAEGQDVETATPVRIAVFPFELEDFSAAGRKAPGPADASFLNQATEEAKQQLARSGGYSVINAAGAHPSPNGDQELRKCSGCEASIAMSLGADQALLGVVTKISMTEYVVNVRVSDARSGEPVGNFTTDLRMGSSDSWSRGVRWLMQNRMLATE